MQGERERCLAAGMDDYLCKPVSEAVLRHTLKRWFPGAVLGEDESRGAAIADGEAGAAWRQMLASQPEMIPRLVDTFLDTSAGSLEAMREALQRGDGPELANMAHALKGACLQLGETGVAEHCDRLEEAGHNGDQDAAEATMVQLSAAFEQASAGLVALKARSLRVE
jgi:HPt (histidine-containing phosphotransfer) domain-containing protein